MWWRRPSRRGPVFEPGNGWIRVCEAVMYPLTRLTGRRHFSGIEHLTVPGPILVVANHISLLDPVQDAVFVRRSGRWPHILAKASLWRIPVVGAALRGTEQIPVERTGGQGQAALAEGVAALAEGRAVLVYAEGTVTRDPGHWPMRPRPGAAAMALTGDFPVIPVANWGTHQVLPYKGRPRLLPRRDIHVKAGPPIDLSAFRGRPVDARLIRDVSLEIMTAIRDLLAEIREEPAPAEFFDPKKAERRAARRDAAPAPE